MHVCSHGATNQEKVRNVGKRDAISLELMISDGVLEADRGRRQCAAFKQIPHMLHTRPLRVTMAASFRFLRTSTAWRKVLDAGTKRMGFRKAGVAVRTCFHQPGTSRAALLAAGCVAAVAYADHNTKDSHAPLTAACSPSKTDAPQPASLADAIADAMPSCVRIRSLTPEGSVCGRWGLRCLLLTQCVLLSRTSGLWWWW